MHYGLSAIDKRIMHADCRKKLCGSLDGLFHIYQSAVYAEGGNFRVSAEDSLHLVEALRYYCLFKIAIEVFVCLMCSDSFYIIQHGNYRTSS